jgi:hypothetical protein
MDQIRNPFSPGAGSPPPELAGRSQILEQARVLLGRVKAGRAEKSIIMIGLRGVGKTVLLVEIEKLAQKEGYQTVLLEAPDSRALAHVLVPHLRKLLFELDRIKGAGDKVKRGIRVLKSFIGVIKVKIGDVEFGVDLDPERGTADSGNLEADLPELLCAVAEAAQERHTVVGVLIDEIQYFSQSELSALIMSMHKLQQRQLPLVLIGAGLPILPGLAGESKSYAERLFNFPDVGPLSPVDAAKALQDPVKAAGEKFSNDALQEIIRTTQGYPYFIQEWGYQTWNLASASPIDLEVTRRATSVVRDRLDKNFFRVRFDRLTGREKEYLRAMAELGKGPYRTAEIAKGLGAKNAQLGPVRASLIKKGMIYSPSYGEMAFTVPLFDEFMRRTMDLPAVKKVRALPKEKKR